MKADFVIRRAGRLITCDPALAQAAPGARRGGLGVIEGGALVAAAGEVTWVGADDSLPPIEGEPIEFEAAGRAVLPGLIDSHTHLVFAGTRVAEFESRMRGEAYAAGGIRTTLAATRAATDGELESVALRHLDRFLSFGVTTVEAKSGYGLTVEDESRLLRLARNLVHEIDVVTTLLAAHVVPPEFEDDPDAYVRIVCEDMVPAAVDATFCDAWCDSGAFTVEQCRRVLETGKANGLRPKVHAEQFAHLGGAQLAAELGAVSADHLEFADDADARALAAAGVVAVLLPGASLMTRARRAPARMLLDAGVRVALSTDFNPGSSYSENLPLMLALGCAELGMTVEEAVLAVTRNAAAALGDEGIGCLRRGSRCDVLVLDSDTEVDLAYHYGANLTAGVVKDGRLVYQRGRSLN